MNKTLHVRYFTKYAQKEEMAYIYIQVSLTRVINLRGCSIIFIHTNIMLNF